MSTEIVRTGDSSRRLLAALARSGLSRATVSGYSTDIREYLAWAKNRDVAVFDGLAAWRDDLHTRGSRASTINRKLAAVKRALRLAIEREPSERRAVLEAEIRRARSIRVVSAAVRQDQVLSAGEVNALCSGMSRKGALVVRFLYATGCRVSEALGVRLASVVVRSHRAEIEVSGKGGKTRVVRIRADFLAEIRKAFGGREFLFETATGRPLARQYVTDMIERAARRLLGREGIGAHSLRHSFATALIGSGSGAQAVGEYLGHADPATTLRYYVHETMSNAELDRLDIGAEPPGEPGPPRRPARGASTIGAGNGK
jgi:integrase/recombinase XerD